MLPYDHYGKRFYPSYKNKGKGTSLTERFTEEQLKKKFIIGRDIKIKKDGEDKIIKNYSAFTSIEQYEEFFSQVPEEERIFYEVIDKDTPQKLKFDVDNQKPEEGSTLLYMDITEEHLEIIQQIIKETFNQIYGIPLLSNNLIIANSSIPGKQSWHIIINNYYVSSTFQSKQFYLEVLKNLKKAGLPNLIVATVDPSVYSDFQLFRMPFCHKIGKTNVKKINQNLRGIIPDFRDILITYIKDCKTLPDKFEPPKPQERAVKTQAIEELEKELEFIIENLPNENAPGKATYEAYRNVCFALHHETGGSEFGFDLWLKWAEKYERFDETGTIDLWKGLGDPKNKPKLVKIGTILKYLKGWNPEGWASYLKMKNGGDLAKVRPQFIRSENSYSERFCRPLPLTEELIALQSYMGTGKTTVIKNLIAETKPARILYFSARKPFSWNITQALIDDTGLPFQCYDEKKVKENLLECPYLVIQMESLFKLRDFDIFDLVIGDEIESCLKQFNSEDTMGVNILDNIEIFAELIKTGRKVILCDAFLSQRTLEVVKEITENRPLHTIVNTFVPDPRIAYEYKKKEPLFDSCVKYLAEGKKILFVFTSLTAAERFEKSHIKGKEISYVFYEGGSGDEIDKELRNVRAAWKDKQLVMYTPKVIVGVNYDIKDDFDMVFVYGSCLSATVRDIFQMTLRVRYLKDNVMHFYLDKRRYGAPEADTRLIAIEAQVKAKYSRMKALFEERRVKYSQPAEWVKKSYIHNILEANCSTMLYDKLFKEYLKFCGYTLKNETEIAAKPDKDGALKGIEGYLEENLGYSDIVVDSESVKVLIEKVKNGEASRMEKLQMDKYCFECFLQEDTIEDVKAEIWTEIWRKRKDQIKNLYLEKNYSIKQASDLKLTEIADLLFTDNSILELRQIKALCKALGLKNSQDNDTIIERSTVEKLCEISPEIEPKLASVFRFRDRSTGKISSEKWLMKMFSKIFKYWGGSKIKAVNKRKITVEGKRVNVSDYQIEVFCEDGIDLWNTITESVRYRKPGRICEEEIEEPVVIEDEDIEDDVEPVEEINTFLEPPQCSKQENSDIVKEMIQRIKDHIEKYKLTRPELVDGEEELGRKEDLSEKAYYEMELKRKDFLKGLSKEEKIKYLRNEKL